MGGFEGQCRVKRSVAVPGGLKSMLWERPGLGSDHE
jgi:hypothetical protein